MRDHSQLPHLGCLYQGGMATGPGKPREGCNPCIWERFTVTAPRPGSYVSRLAATAGGLPVPATSAAPGCPSARGKDDQGTTFCFSVYCHHFALLARGLPD